ncbi:MAG: hypothetical protein QG622_684 [Actinomycetota bacterium]|nr:hypothetical protein [Actinomycetota bacterium]
MKIAIPMAGGEFCAHFGQSTEFALFEVDDEGRALLSRQDLPAPAHEHGSLPRWVAEQAATHLLAGGMGAHAQELLAEAGVSVVLGVTPDDPEKLVADFLAGRLVNGDNSCGNSHTCSH